MTITGALTFVPNKAAQRVSKSFSRGDAELHTGIRTCFKPGNFSLTAAKTSAIIIKQNYYEKPCTQIDEFMLIYNI